MIARNLSRATTLEVNSELYKTFTQFLSIPRDQYFKQNDADKNLELDLCKVFFKDANRFSAPTNWQEECSEVDVWVDGIPVQVKCRGSKNHLYLEDYKIRSNGQKTSWVDRCEAKYVLFVYPNSILHLDFVLYDAVDLKIVLNTLRQKDNLHEERLYWLDNFLPNWKFAEYRQDEVCAIYDIVV